MPVSAVAGETGSVETKDGANVTGTQPSHQLIKPRSRDGPARRAAKIVVDDLDISKSTPSRFLDKFILASLALAIELYLGGRGLTDINHGLPL
jgi:hypothetical protein